MNEAQIVYCEKVLKNILSKPVSSLFLDYSQYSFSEMNEANITLNYVSEKLSRCLYPSIESFLNDLVNVLLPATKMRRFCIRKAAADYLMNLIPNLETTELKSGPDFLEQAGKVDKLFSEAIKICETVKPNTERKECDAEPSSFVIEHEKVTYTPSELYGLVALIKDPQQIIKLVQFVYKMQPECVCIAENLTFIFSLMKDETADMTAKYLMEMIKEAAKTN